MLVTRSLKLSVLGLTFVAVGCASLPEYEPITPALVDAEPRQAQVATAPQPVATSGSFASLEASRSRIQECRALGLQVNEAERLLAAAEAAAAENDAGRATDLAIRAQRLCDAAINQYYASQAERELAEAREYANLSRAQYDRLKAGEAALLGQRAEEAVAILSQLNAELAVAQSLYTVISGDSLWKISARDEVYGNPYWWPLIYKNNADQLADPDLLEVGQVLNIRVHPTISEVNAAVDHAHTRGSWTVGGVEEVDGSYLNR